MDYEIIKEYFLTAKGWLTNAYGLVVEFSPALLIACLVAIFAKATVDLVAKVLVILLVLFFLVGGALYATGNTNYPDNVEVMQKCLEKEWLNR